MGVPQQISSGWYTFYKYFINSLDRPEELVCDCVPSRLFLLIADLKLDLRLQLDLFRFP